MNKQQAEEKIQNLIERYKHLSSEEIKKYNEANTRKNFILPLFEALGWDTRGEEVVEEECASGKRVDYGFKIGGITKFFLEAKPFSSNLNDPRWTEQAIWYAWHKSIPWVILSDFESIKVFNAEWDAPNPENSLFFEISYDKYIDDFERLWWLSKESFEKGVLDAEALKWGKKPKRIPVDKQLVADLLYWRDSLFKNFIGHNPLVKKEKISENVQRVLNRLIFIRTCEDRGFEERVLQEIVRNWEERGHKNDELVNNLRKLFLYFDKNYDSKLFEERVIFESEKFVAEDEILAKVIEGTYKSSNDIRWNFNHINADVLGSIYEQYLGQIQKEEKNDEKLNGKTKRKSQGIYYTPRYIVDYIVSQTLGEVLKNKDSEKIRDIKILDPACGSGSFLIRAYEELINYWEAKLNKSSKFKKDTHLGAFEKTMKQKEGRKTLSAEAKMNTLRNNIYGVDLDEQAVEIAQLNLLLKTVDKRTKLPNLQHILCGNSLISGEEKELKKYFGRNWKDKKPFNWQERFPEVFKEGGFDVIIGNPPWVTLLHEEIGQGELNYFRDRYSAAAGFKLNLFPIFIERALELCGPGGFISFIVPNRLLDTPSYRQLMKKIIDRNRIAFIVDIPEGSFVDVVAGNIIIGIQRKSPADKITVLKNVFSGKKEENILIDRENIIKNNYVINLSFNKNLSILFRRIDEKSQILKNYTNIHVGMMIKDKKEVLELEKFNKSNRIVLGRDFDRYTINKMRFFDLGKISIFGGTKNPEKHLISPKILVRKTGNNLVACYDDQHIFAEQSVYLVLPKNNIGVSPKYLLAIINSKLLTFYFRKNLITNPEAYPYIQHYDLEKIPIFKINFSDQKEKIKHDELVKLVDKILKLNKELQKLDPIMDDKEYNEIKDAIEKTDKLLDQKVYKLYGLTKEEIKIIEKNNSK